MPFFQYRARDKAGALVTGALEAESRGEIEAALDRMGLIPLKVVPGRGHGRTIDLKGLLQPQVSQSDIILFSRQLSTLFNAGVPLTRALFALERQALNPRFAGVVKKIREDVEGGSTFSGAISRHPKVFTDLYANMAEAGEAGGILDGVLSRLAFMYEKNAENRAKVRSATLYPKIVVVAIVAAVAILMNFVVPKFAKLYESFKVELPLPTKMLILLSNLFTHYWYIPPAVAAGGWLALRAYLSTPSGRFNWDRLVLRVPVFGQIMMKSLLSRFARVLGSLYKSGMPILQSLDIASRAVENKFITGEIKAIEDGVRAGKSLSEPMEKSSAFPPMVVQMVTVGEETGNLDEMLEKVAEYYDQEVDSSIRNLTTTLEPILLGVIFVMVLFLALAIFLPMWDILKIVRR